MLKLVIPDVEHYDESDLDPANHKFVTFKGATLELEHSLISISKWESIWKKPFLSKDEKTMEEHISYIQCMTMSKNVNPDVYKLLTLENHAAVAEYVKDSKTATWINDTDNKKKKQNQTTTSELIYYWMVAHNIPWEAQRWHLSRLIMLIQVCNEKSKAQDGKKKRRKPDYAKQNALNKARREAAGHGG